MNARQASNHARSRQQSLSSFSLGLAAMKRRHIISISFAITIILTFELLQLSAVPVHAADDSWDPYHTIAVDAKIERMAARARFDGCVCGLPEIGRGNLRLLSAARHDSDYDVFFQPTWVSDTLVVYRFKADGKALWKTCKFW
jgi:hypothetical protein